MVLVVVRVADMPKDVAAANSNTSTCDECGQDVWVAPSTMLLIREQAARSIVNRMVCMPCVMPKLLAAATNGEDVHE